MGEVIAQAQGHAAGRPRRMYERYGHTGERKSGIGFATVRGGDIVGDHGAVRRHRRTRGDHTQVQQPRRLRQGNLRAVRYLAGQRAGMFDLCSTC